MKTRNLITSAVIVLLIIVVAGCSRGITTESSVPPPTSELATTETTAISVFYPTGKIVIEERRVVPVQENLVEVALKEVYKADPEKFEIVIVQPRARVLSVEVDDNGLCTINFSKEMLDFPEDSRQAKLVAFAAIVETLKQFENIKEFQILVEGKSSGEIDGRSIEEFWGDISLKKQPFPINRENNPETTSSSSN